MPAQKSSSEAHFGLRLLIILYGLGIVAIGSYPIQREHGSVMAFVKKQTTAFANSSDILSRIKPKLTLPAASDGSAAEKKSRDHLTERDRTELNRLIGDL